MNYPAIVRRVAFFALLTFTVRAAASPADTFFEKGEFAKASSACLAEIHTHPHSAALHLEEARILLRLDNWQRAVAQAQSAEKLKPGSADAHGLLSVALMRAGEPAEAAAEARKAAALQPSGYYSLLAQARLDYWNDDNTGAKNLLEKAVQLYPARPGAYAYLLPLFNSVDHKGAYAYLSAYLKLHPQGYPHKQILEQLHAVIQHLSPFYAKKEGNKPGFPDHSIGSISADSSGGAAQGISACTLQIEQRNDSILLPVTIQGKRFLLLLDTGAGYGVGLVNSAAQRLNLPVEGSAVLQGVSGSETDKTYHANTMQVGSDLFHKVEVTSMSSLPDQRIDGLIGGGNFSNSVLTLDFANSSLTIQQGPGAQAPAPMEGDHVMQVPFHFYHGYIFVSALLADSSKPSWELLDTGAQPLGVLSLVTAHQLAKKQRKDSWAQITINQRLGVGNTATGFTALVFRFAVDLTMAHTTGTPFLMEMNPIFGASMMDTQISPEFGFQLSGIVGFPYLTNAKRVSIDYPHRLLTMEFSDN